VGLTSSLVNSLGRRCSLPIRRALHGANGSAGKLRSATRPCRSCRRRSGSKS
jgi:hypothetical protein